MTDSLFDLTGQVAIVTGTSRGLGQYFARALAKAGADLVLTSRRRGSLANSKRRFRALGRRCVSLELDVRDHASIERMAAEAESAFGQIHILVNNAGLQRAQARTRHFLGRLEPGARHEFARQLFRRTGHGAENDRARLRTHHQHRFGDQRRWLCRTCTLRREPRRHSAAHDEPCGRLGSGTGLR